MENNKEALGVAEEYLTEMLKADRDEDYEGFVCRFEKSDLEDFGKDDFLKDTALMRDELGPYQRRDFLGALNGFKDDDRPGCLRFVWRAYYEKNEALIVVGIHQKNGIWYVNESTVSK
ncbi:hypothetical protein MIB92_14435 [Aestuariirhabdus sp. Z084]|uniref:hypothetical protein n=1 Tax=Aestuariirhabdus haliotis TaxID=2918751 RepID=UPI00201B3DE6|nr:hypothetical protein [Aestuariirhabdus haliotis]MCL6416855.1 hypothetical protein [Aestuariirhabdus haliotis]MCL6420869.1 hypothetical protein [Aestuariirhabdus haliotis]